MNHIGLFEGIGGFSLAARWAGWNTIAWCEWNQFGQQVLKYHFTTAIPHGDITKTDFTIYRGQCDILTGGFPCQPYSTAGKRKGKEDERHLWPEMLRAIREIAPTWVVGENVRGLTNWNGGMVFDEVQADLEAEGYEVTPFLLPACAVDAPHRRDRIWFVAFNVRNSYSGGRNKGQVKEIFRKKQGTEPSRNCEDDASNTYSGRLERPVKKRRYGKYVKWKGIIRIVANTNSRRQPSKESWQTKSGWLAEKSISGDWENFPTQSPVCNGNDGIPTRLDGITFPKWRNESIKAGGNAIVPQVAYQIFKAINKYNKQ